VVGSGSWPAWTWRVSKRSLRLVGMAIGVLSAGWAGFRCVGIASY
jgi:hypothetical protein